MTTGYVITVHDVRNNLIFERTYMGIEKNDVWAVKAKYQQNGYIVQMVSF